MLAVTFYDVVLWVHITAVVVAFGFVFTYPLLLRRAVAGTPAERAAIHDLQATIGRRVISPGMVVVLLAGAYLASDAGVWSEIWVSIPLLILIVIGGIGGGYLSPREERLAELARSGSDDAAYSSLLGQVRTVSYVLMVLVVVAIFFMTTKLGG